jgi:cell division protein FtsL
MNKYYFVLIFIALIAVIAVQLIKLNIYVLKMKKSGHLLQQKIKEDENWEFIKGLY